MITALANPPRASRLPFASSLQTLSHLAGWTLLMTQLRGTGPNLISPAVWGR
jgi:hypothetical protein